MTSAEFNEIERLCVRYNIRDYHINTDGSVDVYNDVDLGSNKLKEIPIKFRQVNDYFLCNDNYLTTLIGCPERVNGQFDCDLNNLTNLEGCPKYVYGNFYCQQNNITTFEGGPKHIEDKFWCGGNPIYWVFILINADRRWNNMDFFNELDILRENKTLVLMRLNAFLLEFGKKPVEFVKDWKII